MAIDTRSSSLIEKRLMEAGAKNLREFGYPSATADNILSDAIFRAFFEGMLKSNLGNGQDKAIKKLLAEIEAYGVTDAD